mmetsp:Transcript_45019/g.82276  ORF Transcript_45019/g.82276 Transcript_45019/m.82276 type:complete len:202 (+) Transcript_45019:45-650(+)
MVSRQLILGFVAQEGSALSDVPSTFKADPEIVTAAVSDDGYALKYAAEELRGDRDVVIAAVQQNGHALQFASTAMRSNAEVVIAAVRQTRFAIEYLVPELLLDEDFRAELPCLEDVFILKVSMLSGRSCIIVSEADNREDELSHVLKRCAERLGLTSADAGRAVLLLEAHPVPDTHVCEWPGLLSGQVHELQLVLLPADPG